MDRRTFLTAATGLGATVTLAGCLGSSASGEFDIGMSTRRFKPATFEVAPGTTVVWKNTSSHAHTISAYQDQLPDGAEYWATGGFDSESAARQGWRNSGKGGLTQGESYEREFTVPGTHNYVCIPHEQSGMSGVIVVTDDAETTGTVTATAEP